MKIYLIKSPEYESDNFREVNDILTSSDGPLQFIPSYYEFDKEDFYFLNYELYPHHNFDYPCDDNTIRFDPEIGNPLSWRELFSLCNFYREVFNIEDDSFVVLLTKRKNALNWFSAVDESKNIFVHTADWELYTDINAKYPIAYQVVENVLQSLMKIDIVNIPNEFVHEPLKGCMNDFCDNKSQIIIKLQTANICENCIKKIKKENINPDILRQVKTIFNGIRNEFIFKAENQATGPLALVIDSDARILLPDNNLEIKLTPLFKTLYLFFLSKPEGVTLAQLRDFRVELLNIYRKLRPNAAEEDAKSRIDNLSHPFGDGFNPTKAHINRTITELLNDPLADFYRISGTAGNPYSIKIPRNLVDIRY